MPGFGYGPFGGGVGSNHPYGRYPWSRKALWDQLPEIHRLEDAESGGDTLRTFMESLGDEFDRIHTLISDFDDIRDPTKVRTKYNQTARLRLGDITAPLGRIKRRGVDGALTGSTPGANFYSPTARFTSSNIGQDITISRATIAGNNKTVTILAVVSLTEVVVSGNLSAEAGPLRWDLRAPGPSSRGEVRVEVLSGDVSLIRPGWVLRTKTGVFVVASRQQFTDPEVENELLTAREGTDGTVDSSGLFVAAGGAFTQEDVGRVLSLPGNNPVTANRGPQHVQAVINGTTLSTTRTLVRGADSNGGVYYYQTNDDLSGFTLRVRHVVSGIGTALSVVLATGRDEVPNEVTVNLATDATGAVTTTATALVAALSAPSAATSGILRAEVSGTGASLCTATEYVDVLGHDLTESAVETEWALYRPAVLNLQGVGVLEGAREQSGHDMTATATNTFSSPTALFTSDDIGKTLVVHGSPTAEGNDGAFPILTVPTANTVTVAGTPLTVAATSLAWSLHSTTDIGNGVEVDVYAPSLLKHLGDEYGVDISEVVSEEKQRSLVSNVHKWLGLKGVATGYDATASIDGFKATATQLFYTAGDMTVIPAANQFFIGENATGRYGVDATLSISGSRVRVTSPTAVFTPADAYTSKLIRIRSADTGSNNKNYVIDNYISPTEVEFIDPTTVSLADANNGALVWAIGDIFTDLEPRRPLFDEINTDAMEEHVNDLGGPGVFTADMWCWESNWYASIDVDINTVTTLSTGRHRLNVDTAPSISAGSTPELHEIITSPQPVVNSDAPIGVWKIVDANGLEVFLETIPEDLTGTWQFEVVTSVAPITGLATISYVCPLDITCSFCPSRKVLVKIQDAGPPLSNTVPDQETWDRLIRHFREVTPAHVELVVIMNGMETADAVFAPVNAVQVTRPEGTQLFTGRSTVQITSIAIV